MTINSSMNSIDVLSEIASNQSNVESFSICVLEFAPLLQDRCHLSDLDQKIADQALKLRSDFNFPFWDGALLASMESETPPIGIIRGANFHQSIQEKIQQVQHNDFTRDFLFNSSSQASENKTILAINSAVKLTDGNTKHIPLLDFHVSYSSKSTALVVELLSNLGLSGWLLNSGKSYHFYGDNLLSDNELITFLGKMLLFAPIVDRCWIAHQMIELSCTLRISSRPDYGGPPRLVCRI